VDEDKKLVFRFPDREITGPVDPPPDKTKKKAKVR
jgi:hypothetical protein